eukprot:Gb_33002 [translate_table: standard]
MNWQVHNGGRGGKYLHNATVTPSKEAGGLTVNKSPAILQPTQDNDILNSTVPGVSHEDIVKAPTIIVNSNNREVTPNKIDSILLKLDRSGFSSIATEKTDMYQHDLSNFESSHSSSSSVNANGPTTVFTSEVSSQTYVTHEKEQAPTACENAFHDATKGTDLIKGKTQALDSGDQTAYQNATNWIHVTEQKKQVLDLAYQIASQNEMNQTSGTEKKEQVLDSANQITFQNAKNKTCLTEGSGQVLDTAYDTAIQNATNWTNVIDKNKLVPDLAHQTACQDATKQTNVTEEKEHVLASAHQTVFISSLIYKRVKKAQGFFSRNMLLMALRMMAQPWSITAGNLKGRAGSPVVHMDFNLPAVLKVKKCCSSVTISNKLSPEEKSDSGSKDVEVHIKEISQDMKDFDDNSQACKICPSLKICMCNYPSNGYMIKCVACERQFHAGCVNLRNKGLDEALACTELIYTCQNCKTEHNKKRRKLGCLTTSVSASESEETLVKM